MKETRGSINLFQEGVKSKDHEQSESDKIAVSLAPCHRLVCLKVSVRETC